MEFLKIDGSFGEGGGQIIRSAVTLSCITKKPIQIENIRKNRKKSGLRPQHLIGIKLLGKICNAKIGGLEVGSTSIQFEPGDIEDSNIKEEIGTAGSIPLICQTLIPAVSVCGKQLTLEISGGTDVPWSPTSDYTNFVLKEAYHRMGINFSLDVKKRGYYPKGGGIIRLEVSPSSKLKPILLSKRETSNAKIHCSFSKIEKEIITKEITEIVSILEKNNFSVNQSIKNENALDSGSSLLISSIDNNSIIGFDNLISDNKFDKSISKKFLSSNLGVDSHLADMLVLPASMTNEISVFRVKEITKHLETNLYVTSKFTGAKYGIGKLDDGFEVRIIGNSDSSIQ